MAAEIVSERTDSHQSTGLQVGASRTDSVSMKSLSIALLLAVVSVACGGSDPLAGVTIEEIEEGLS